MARRKRYQGQPDNIVPIEPDDVGDAGSRRKRLRRYNKADRKRRASQPISSAGWERARDRTCSRCGERTRDFPRGPEQPCRRCLFGPPVRVRFVSGGAPGMGKRHGKRG